jgi:integrase
MSVTVRPYKRGGWHVDIRLVLPDGQAFRQRKRINTPAKSVAQRWGQDRERHLLQHGLPQPKKEVPTVQQFAPRFLEGYARANQQKPSGIAAKETIINTHLVPLLGAKTLDAVSNEAVQRLKHALRKKAPKTVNNVLTVLNVMLKKAVEWEVITQMPCTIRLLPIPPFSASFHDFDEYERLVKAAKDTDWQTYLIVLLGGEAGLRCGEMIALEWRDVDFANRQLCIRRSDWNGQVTSPKGGRLRYVPLTVRLGAALHEHRHLRHSRVLCQCGATPLTRQQAQYKVKRAARRANVRDGVHMLRHTFCSHLAMRGASARAVQELAGHRELSMTQRYMHLSPNAIKGAIQLLDARTPVPDGNMMATARP